MTQYPKVIENKFDPIVSSLFSLDGDDYIGKEIQFYFDATFFQEKSDSILREKFKALITQSGKALMLISKPSLNSKINIPCLFIYELNVECNHFSVQMT
jgi:hypothetical protein